MKEKKDKIDVELSQLLKQQSYQENTNEWFTPRVLNKLPAKQDNSARHMAWGFYVAAVLVCLALIGALVYAALQLPAFGGADTLVDSEVSAPRS